MVKKSELLKMSLADLQALVEAKKQEERKRLPALLAKRDKLQAELDAVTQQIEMIGGEEPKPKAKAARAKGRPSGAKTKGTAPRKASRRGGKRRGQTLPQALLAALQAASAPMSPHELCNSLTESKHPSSKSKSFRLMVTNALSKRPEFTRVGHGQYEATK